MRPRRRLGADGQATVPASLDLGTHRIRLRARRQGARLEAMENALLRSEIDLYHRMLERAQEMGGAVTVNARPGSGTEVKVVLPATHQRTANE